MRLGVPANHRELGRVKAGVVSVRCARNGRRDNTVGVVVRVSLSKPECAVRPFARPQSGEATAWRPTARGDTVHLALGIGG
jgi:hypothetical protein